MPRPRHELDEYRDEIERRIANRQTQNQILSWLASQQFYTSKNTLSSRCVAWAACRRTTTAASEDLVSAIDMAYHTTNHSDNTIAENITAQGIPTTMNQVKEYA
jgi:hypothetical protein